MLPSIDLHTKQKKKLFICNSRYNVISPLKEADKINYTINAGKLNELSFSVPLYTSELTSERKENKHISLLLDRSIIKLKYNTMTEYFIITGHEDTEEEYRNIKCFSLGYQLNDRIIKNYKSYDYVPVTDPITNVAENVWMPAAVNIETAFNDALQRHRNWNVVISAGVDLTIKRYFEFDSKTPLEYAYEIAEKFNVILDWDTENRIITVYDSESYGTDRGFKISDEKYLTNLVKKSSQDEFATRLSLYGKDNITINSISPTGQSYIDNFSYFMNSGLMSGDLKVALSDYDAYVDSRKGEYPALLDQLNIAQSELSTLNAELSDLKSRRTIANDRVDIIRSANGVKEIKPYRLFIDSIKPYSFIDRFPTDEYRVYFFKLTYQRFPYPDEIPTIKFNSLNIPYVKLGWHNVKFQGDSLLELDNWTGAIHMTGFWVKITSDEHTNLTTDQLSDKYNIYRLDELISDKQGEVNNKQAEIDSIKVNIETLQNDLAIESHLSDVQLSELDDFIIEKEYYDENLTTPESLLEEGKKQLSDRSIPIFAFDVSLVNFFELQEEKRNWNKLYIYDLVRLESNRLNIDVKARVISIHISDDSIGLTIADTQNTKGEPDKFIAMLYGAVSGTKVLNKNKSSWNQVTKVKSDFEEYSSSPIDSYSQPVQAGNRVTMDESGLKSFAANDDTEYVVMSNGVIASCPDGGNWVIVADPKGTVAKSLHGIITISDTLAFKNLDETVSVTRDKLIVGRNSLSITGIPTYSTLPLLNGWSLFSSDNEELGYLKNPDSVVYLKGVIASGATGSTIATLPVGFRPKKSRIFTVMSSGSIGRVDITPDGSIIFVSGSSTYVSFDGLSFIAEQ